MNQAKREKLLKKFTGYADFGEKGGKIYDVDIIHLALIDLKPWERINPYKVGEAVLSTFAQVAPNLDTEIVELN